MNKKEPINILIACDKNYAPYYGVLLYSLFEHNRDSCFDIYLITDGSWSKQQEAKFTRLCSKNHSRFFIHVVDAETVKNYPVTPNYHVNLSAYYHILSPFILPKEIEKIIYMDGDMLVCDNISDLWEIDMDDYAMAAAWDSVVFRDETYERLGYDKRFGYVNNGVSIINLRYWREHRVYEKAIEYMDTHSEVLCLMDQDTENAVLAGKIKKLPITYNFQIMFLCEYYWKQFTSDFKQEILQIRQPKIIHYNGGVKPWSWRYYALPYRKEWLRAYWKSPWFFAYKIAPIGKYIKHLIKRVVSRKQLLQAQRSQYIPESYGL